MCKDCVKSEYPDRANMCLDSGAFLVNFKGCSKCEITDKLKDANRTETEEDEHEIIKYHHTCTNCNHIVAEHEHRFKVEDEFQVYEMYCLLCGTGEDARSVLPTDPRQQPLFF